MLCAYGWPFDRVHSPNAVKGLHTNVPEEQFGEPSCEKAPTAASFASDLPHVAPVAIFEFTDFAFVPACDFGEVPGDPGYLLDQFGVAVLAHAV